MGTEQSFRVALEIRLDDHGSVAGVLRGETGDPIQFSGWLGLVAALTGLADRTPDPASLLAGRVDPPETSEESR